MAFSVRIIVLVMAFMAATWFLVHRICAVFFPSVFAWLVYLAIALIVAVKLAVSTAVIY